MMHSDEARQGDALGQRWGHARGYRHRRKPGRTAIGRLLLAFAGTVALVGGLALATAPVAGAAVPAAQVATGWAQAAVPNHCGGDKGSVPCDGSGGAVLTCWIDHTQIPCPSTGGGSSTTDDGSTGDDGVDPCDGVVRGTTDCGGGSDECYTRGGDPTACDADDCGEGQCTRDCFSAAAVRVPCDSDECTAGEDCVPACTDAAVAVVDCGDPLCASDGCTRDCLDAAGSHVACDAAACVTGTECETPPAEQSADPEPAPDTAMVTIARLDASAAGGALAETGVKLADLSYVALALLGAGAGLLVLARVRGRRSEG